MTEHTSIAGLERDTTTGQWFIRTQHLADIALRDPHLGMTLDPDRASTEIPSSDATPTVAQFFELWYRRGANHPVLGPALRKAYGPGAVGTFEADFQRLAAARAAELPANGDLLEDFVLPYCLHSTFRLMGFPRAEWANLTKVYHVLMYVVRARFRGILEFDDRRQQAFASAMHHLRRAVDELRTGDRPTPLATALGQYADAEGPDPWGDMATIGQLLAAGVPQVTTGIAVAARELFGSPELLASVRAGEVDVAQVAEEAMRLNPPFLGVFAWVNEPCDCLGVRLEPRDPVVVDILAVNADPSRVSDPAEFCPARNRNANYTFGKGAHYCLGAASARLQIAAGLEALVGLEHPLKLGELRLDNDGFSLVAKAAPYAVGQPTVTRTPEVGSGTG